MRISEIIVESQGVVKGLSEAREGAMREIIRKKLPGWPDYVIKDWISSRIKNEEDLKNLQGWLGEINKMVRPNSWQLHQKMFLRFDMLNPRSRYFMKTKRKFGDRNPFMVPRDKERLEDAIKLVQAKGIENLPPVIMLQHTNGLELCEGWHRTMAAFRLQPEGFYINVWIGQAGQQGVAEGSLEELANTSLKVKEPKDLVNTNDRKQVTYKVMKFKSGKNKFLINFTVKGAPAFGKKSNWNAVNVAFGVREKQDEYSFGDEMNTDLTARNKNQFLIYSTVINAIRKFITEYNTEIDEIIIQGAGERQVMMYQRFFQVAPKYFPGWHYDGEHSLVRDVPRQTGKKVREQGVAEDHGEPIQTT